MVDPGGAVAEPRWWVIVASFVAAAVDRMQAREGTGSSRLVEARVVR